MPTASLAHDAHTGDTNCTALCDVLCHCLSAMPVFVYWQAMMLSAHVPTALRLTFESAPIGMRYRPPIARMT